MPIYILAVQNRFNFVCACGLASVEPAPFTCSIRDSMLSSRAKYAGIARSICTKPSTMDGRDSMLTGRARFEAGDAQDLKKKSRNVKHQGSRCFHKGVLYLFL